MSGGVWIASYVMLWIAVLVLAAAVVALLRQVGVLHARLRPMGVHFAGEGPPRLEPAPLPDEFDYQNAELTVLAFTSPSCEICARLMPGLRAVAREYGEVQLHVVNHGPNTTPVFGAFNVRSTPYVVAVARDGIVRARGVANTLEQVEVMVYESLHPVSPLDTDE